ncbi:hypothetical protein IAQ61_004371 [Plenodomus lingam]|uniref:Uncharacterized protein n=1 Tax=Leptosphaeria maculans (strain JN3 / isolate v23.1.3 / race Av1-4-5-6-7-8) TaxID=985895 RepID=E4ZVB4_LEPMJ|nr:hypothetical protein LEMA_P026920.1 [Plenodomus lingam JN3]KAH9873744.1 hypothetical protein IAQ61_004371 [Plenodomus lingam]CBX95540.1 hypothetical protein LEMA_P026920.1 [Plenodomus lingam JN3]
MAAVAQSRIQDDVHPLLRHPRPIKRDPAKAQRMLGLIADSEENFKELQREKSVTTRWLERPMYEHLEKSNVESERKEVGKVHEYEKESSPVQEASKEEVAVKEQEEENDADLLDRWTNPNRPTSVRAEALQGLVEPKTLLDTSFAKKRPQPLNCPRPISYNAQHLLSPEWTASPSTMSPNTPAQSTLSHPDHIPASSIASSPSSVYSDRIVHQQPTWAAPTNQIPTRMRAERPVSFQPQSSQPLGSPQAAQRPRPTSFATYHQKNRSNTKIASSRGLRNNSFPNLSTAQAIGSAKAVPGEQMENDVVYNRFADDEVGPPTPSSPFPTSPMHTAVTFTEQEEEVKVEKKQKNRWSAIPQTFKKLAARRRSSAAMQERPTFEVKVDNPHKMNLTEENLAWYEQEVNHIPSTPRSRLSAVDLVPTPAYSPTNMSQPSSAPQTISSSKQMAPLPLPFAPWAAGAPPSPAATADRRRSSGQSSLSPNRNSMLHHHPSAEVVPQALRPASSYSHRSSLVLPSPPCSATHPYHQHQPQPATYSAPASPRLTYSRLGTPIPHPTCILCKTSKPSYEFVDRRITANCWHEPATCLGCMQAWIQNLAHTQGWDRCACPECGEAMSAEDVGAFVDTGRYMR